MMSTENSVETSTDAQKLCGLRRQQLLSMCQLTTIMLSVIPEDRSKDAWIAAKLKQEWEASGPETKTLDDSKQTANWGRSVQSIHEEVGTGGQFSM